MTAVSPKLLLPGLMQNGLLHNLSPGCALGGVGEAPKLNYICIWGSIQCFPNSKMQMSSVLKSDFVLLLPDLSYFLALIENS